MVNREWIEDSVENLNQRCIELEQKVYLADRLEMRNFKTLRFAIVILLIAMVVVNIVQCNQISDLNEEYDEHTHWTIDEVEASGPLDNRFWGGWERKFELSR